MIQSELNTTLRDWLIATVRACFLKKAQPRNYVGHLQWQPKDALDNLERLRMKEERKQDISLTHDPKEKVNITITILHVLYDFLSKT